MGKERRGGGESWDEFHPVSYDVHSVSYDGEEFRWDITVAEFIYNDDHFVFAIGGVLYNVGFFLSGAASLELKLASFPTPTFTPPHVLLHVGQAQSQPKPIPAFRARKPSGLPKSTTTTCTQPQPKLHNLLTLVALGKALDEGDADEEDYRAFICCRENDEGR